MVFNSPFLYFSSVVIWGTTFFAIRFQLGQVDAVISVAWRFLLAAAVLFAWIAYKRLPCHFSRRQHGWILLQGLTIFSVNYVLVYQITEVLTSGLVAVLYAIVVPMNIINGALFLRNAVSPAAVVAALLGCCGLTLVFWPEVSGVSGNSQTYAAIGIGLIAIYCTSISNIVTARNHSEGMPVLQSNAFGMLYGSIATLIYAFVNGIPLDFSLQPSYIWSLLHLSVFGSVLAFGAYLSLIGRVGADRAAYATVMFPVVALLISTVFEDYHWPPEAMVGLTLVLLGNLMLLNKSLLKKLQSLIKPASSTRPRSPSTEK